MIVTIPDRRYWPFILRTIEIEDHCPSCGEPRGEPYWYRFHDTGDWHSVNKWDNPCGHIDKYSEILKNT